MSESESESDFGPGVGGWSPKFSNRGVGVPQKQGSLIVLLDHTHIVCITRYVSDSESVAPTGC